MKIVMRTAEFMAMSQQAETEVARDNNSHSQQSEFSYQYQLGERRGRVYTLGVRADPSLNAVESFAVVLFFQLPDGTRIPVVRVDDSPHDDGHGQDIHVDRYDRELGVEVREYRDDITGWEDAADFVEENWKLFADRYYERHEDKRRLDSANV